MGGDKLLDQIFNLKFTSKQLVKSSSKCEKEEKAEKLKVTCCCTSTWASKQRTPDMHLLCVMDQGNAVYSPCPSNRAVSATHDGHVVPRSRAKLLMQGSRPCNVSSHCRVHELSITAQ